MVVVQAMRSLQLTAESGERHQRTRTRKEPRDGLCKGRLCAHISSVCPISLYDSLDAPVGSSMRGIGLVSTLTCRGACRTTACMAERWRGRGARMTQEETLRGRGAQDERKKVQVESSASSSAERQGPRRVCVHVVLQQ